MIAKVKVVSLKMDKLKKIKSLKISKNNFTWIERLYEHHELIQIQNWKRV